MKGKLFTAFAAVLIVAGIAYADSTYRRLVTDYSGKYASDTFAPNPSKSAILRLSHVGDSTCTTTTNDLKVKYYAEGATRMYLNSDSTNYMSVAQNGTDVIAISRFGTGNSGTTSQICFTNATGVNVRIWKQ